MKLIFNSDFHKPLIFSVKGRFLLNKKGDFTESESGDNKNDLLVLYPHNLFLFPAFSFKIVNFSAAQPNLQNVTTRKYFPESKFPKKSTMLLCSENH